MSSEKPRERRVSGPPRPLTNAEGPRVHTDVVGAPDRRGEPIDRYSAWLNLNSQQTVRVLAVPMLTWASGDFGVVVFGQEDDQEQELRVMDEAVFRSTHAPVRAGQDPDEHDAVLEVDYLASLTRIQRVQHAVGRFLQYNGAHLLAAGQVGAVWLFAGYLTASPLLAALIVGLGVYCGTRWPRRGILDREEGSGSPVTIPAALAERLAGHEWLPLKPGPSNAVDWVGGPYRCPGCEREGQEGHTKRCERGRAIRWLRFKLHDSANGIE